MAMMDTRLMYGATESSGPTADALLSQSVPKSVAQAASPFVAEFIGTFALVFTVGCCVLSPGEPSWNITAIGLALAALVYATGPVSGGNLNPAVSLALALAGRLSWPVMIGYWVVQVAGGIAAGFCVCALFTPRKAHIEPVPPFTWPYPVTVELVYTCMLCLVVLGCTSAKGQHQPEDSNQFYGVAIGFVMLAGGYAAQGISGACLNPAVAIGFDVSSSPTGATGWSVGWSLAQLSGAVAAALLNRALRPKDDVPSADAAAAPSPLADGRLGARLLAEFLGTFVLVFTVGLNIVMGSPAVPWSAAAAVVSMTYALGSVSGSHFNPAVTMAVAMRFRCSGRVMALYALVQLAAGVVAGLAIGIFHAAGPQQGTTFDIGPGTEYSLTAAGLVEFLFTSVLAYVVVTCGVCAMAPRQQNHYFGMAAGCSVAAGGFSARAVSGGSLNPAVCLGLAVATMCHHSPEAPPRTPLANCIAFSACELAGGMLAAAAARRTHPFELRANAPLLGK